MARVLAIAVLGMLVEGAVVRNAMGLSLSRALPTRTRLALNGTDARTNTAMANDLIASARPGDARAAARYAQRALLREPVDAVAARDGGVAAGLLGQEPALRRRMGYALGLSRRDLPTLMWHLEERVSAGDVAGTLRFYDTALRASRRSGPTLMPVLVRATSDPTVRDAMIGYIARHRPPWTWSFYDTELRLGRDWQALALLTRGLLRAGVPLPGDATDQAIRTVVDAQHPAEAFDLYLAKVGPAGRVAVRNGRFAGAQGSSPFDWNLVQDAAHDAAIADGQLQIDVARDTNGTVASQLLMLRPGRYRLQATVTADPGTGAAVGGTAPYWTIACFPGEAEVARIEAGAARSAGAPFAIGADCRAQRLSLATRATDAPTTYRVANVALRPVG